MGILPMKLASFEAAPVGSPPQVREFSVETFDNPILRHIAYWISGCGALAVFAGIAIHPPVFYTIGAAIVGIVWSVSAIVSWRTRSAIWNIIALNIPMLGAMILRTQVFPGPGFLRVFYGVAVAWTAGFLLLGMFRRRISRVWRFDRDGSGEDV
jgi:hypothetical protein